MSNSNKQVSRKHYFEDYDSKERWMSYWYQINEVLKTGGEKILEIGVGNKIVSNYLKNRGLDVTTVDINPDLNPDYICSIMELTKCFKPNSFDVVLCAQVLEHLPFEEFKKSLDELHQVSRKWIVLSLPYAGASFCVSLKFPGMSKKNLKLKIPLNRKHEFDGPHYWEIGKKGYSRKRILKTLKQNFEIVRSYYPPENLYHLFFALKKKGESSVYRV